MILNPTDQYCKHLLILENMDAESRARLIEDAESVFGSPWSLALKDFFALSDGDLTYIDLDKEDTATATIRQYMWMCSFRECVEQVTNVLQSLQVPQTPEAQRASQKCLKMGFKESTLVFVRRYFGLHNFTEAENISVSDFIVAKKDEYNSALFNYAMREIQKQKLRLKK